jgi:quercetin dioxygenase-like cupin family protein
VADLLEDGLTGQRLKIHPPEAGALIIDVIDPPGSRTPLHVHPEQDERFTVASGRLTVVLNGVRHALGPGDALTIPAGVPHSVETAADQTTSMRWETIPPGRTRELMLGLNALSRSGGPRWRRVLGLAATLDRHRRDIRVLRPPLVLQRLLVAVGRLGGLR